MPLLKTKKRSRYNKRKVFTGWSDGIPVTKLDPWTGLYAAYWVNKKARAMNRPCRITVEWKEP